MPPYGWGIIYNEGNNVFNDEFFIQCSTEAWVRTTTGDLNGDTLDDVLITSNLAEEGAYVMVNELGSFTKLMLDNSYYSSGFITDLNNSGDNDIGLVVQSSVVPLKTYIIPYHNDSLGFVPKDTAYLNGAGKLRCVEDYNQDGYPDLALTSSSWISDPSEDSVFVFLSNKNWGYKLSHRHYIGPYYLPSLFSGDLNMDGYPDLIAFGYLIPTVNHIQILWNDRNGGFIDTNNVYVYQNEHPLVHHVNIYPNPSSGSISIHSGSEKIKALKIVDFNGTTLLHREFSSAQNNTELDLGKLKIQSGIYICVVELENGGVVFEKLILNCCD